MARAQSEAAGGSGSGSGSGSGGGGGVGPAGISGEGGASDVGNPNAPRFTSSYAQTSQAGGVSVSAQNLAEQIASNLAYLSLISPPTVSRLASPNPKPSSNAPFVLVGIAIIASILYYIVRKKRGH